MSCSKCGVFFQMYPDINDISHCPDRETGETPSRPILNVETGEVEMNRIQPRYCTRKCFKLPTNHMKKYKRVHIQSHYMTKKVIPANFPINSIIALLLLSIILLLAPTLSLPLSLVETMLHFWSHKKNKKLEQLNQNTVYYESPLHVITSEFCGYCQFENATHTIGRLQDKKNKRFIKDSIEYVRNVV